MQYLNINIVNNKDNEMPCRQTFQFNHSLLGRDVTLFVLMA